MDSHHRLVVRLGIIPETILLGPAHAIFQALLPADWTVQQVYDRHEVMMLHG
ncbi:hypothetical protein [Leptodesmis sp.]|uniref:hypothetical protein n=1 Tax=Leptodesmis sp. TaxID=3100501 RepID=UPI0040535647